MPIPYHSLFTETHYEIPFPVYSNTPRPTDTFFFISGQTFTIEPMLTIGNTDDVMWRDGWTAVTRDGKWTAQCEHTLLVVEGGVEILTASPKGLWGPLEAVA